jgi:hypothetical protein
VSDLERYEPTPGTVADGILRRAREAGVEARPLRPRADRGGRRITLTFFGPPEPAGPVCGEDRPDSP